MIHIYVKVLNEGGKLKREHISAWIYNMFSKRYHDEGLAKYFNNSGVKAHTFDFEFGRDLKEGDITRITIRGIEPIENKILNKYRDIGIFSDGELIFNELVKDEINLGKVKGRILMVGEEEYPNKEIFNVVTPLILRVSDNDDRIISEDGYKTITPDMDLNLWEELLIKSTKRKADLILGEDVLIGSLDGFEVLDSRECRAELNIKGEKIIYRGMMGKIKITASPAWINFIQRVGLGNRNTYGFGVIK